MRASAVPTSFRAVFLAFLSLAPILSATPPPLADTAAMSDETRSVVYCMEHGHYLNKTLAEFDQHKLLDAYMTDQAIDQPHLFFLQSDVNGFQDQFAPALVHNVKDLGNLEPAYAIYAKFRDRVHDRVAWINQRLSGDFNLSTGETYRVDRKDLPWPATKEEADKLWEQEIRFEMINELLALETREIDASNKKPKAGAAPAQPAAPVADAAAAKPADAAKPAAAPKTHEEKLAAAKDAVRKRYSNYLRSVEESDAIEVQEIFLNALAGQYDPHSNFLSQYALEEFDIVMRNSLVGIGAMLRDKDGFCTIEEFVPNGPAEKSGKFHLGDKIVAVGQAEGDLVDVVGAKLRKTVNLIRGAEGTNVRLQVVPASDPGDKKLITIKREEIKLTTNLAKAQIIEVPVGNQTIPVGVIDLPTFYGKGGAGDNFSTTDDVRELLGKLKAAGVQGIVLDLRRNGGGFLDEAIDLTGLFVPPGPVLQVRDTLGYLKQLKNEDRVVAWDGPLMLLVSKLSASATEILTGALQDYHRALVVGDHSTHGKGTVQAVYHFNAFDPAEKGAAKVTIQKWYLPDGNSIQSKGVTADISLPSEIDFLPIGESDEKNALVWDSVQALPLVLQGDGSWRASLLNDTLVSTLRGQSQVRQQKLDEFAMLKHKIDWEKARQDQKDFSLNFDTRMQQRLQDIAFRDQLKGQTETLAKNNFKSTEVLLNAAKDQAKDKVAAKSAALEPRPASSALGDEDENPEPPVNFDIQLREGLRIMADWIHLHGPPKLGVVPDKVAADAAKDSPSPAGATR